MNSKRIRTLKDGTMTQGPVAVWMSRDQRVRDNWALVFGQEMALTRQVPVCVFFVLVPEFLRATTRQYRFMLQGLQKVEKKLMNKNIPFFLLTGSPEEEVPKFIGQRKISALVKDFDPLRLKRQWTDAVVKQIAIPLYEVDAHNVVPCWIASPKQEFGAYTLRPKIRRLLPEFLDDFPQLKKHPFPWSGPIPHIDWIRSTQVVRAAPAPDIAWTASGEDAAARVLRDFLENKVSSYPERRNDPNADGQSNLSPYLHFGQISAQRIALEVSSAPVSKKSRESFLEELIVRRELADNFCFYNTDYDSIGGFPAWAQKTLDAHRKDRRDYLYTPDQLEEADTHDDLWNAAQKEMVLRGKMHGYLRMYWAKKILEWTESPEQALGTAIYLNDKYELDGRDPNGYAGIAWSIGGLHDRAWAERPVFGKIRFMSYNGCKSKFNLRSYIASVEAMTDARAMRKGDVP